MQTSEASLCSDRSCLWLVVAMTRERDGEEEFPARVGDDDSDVRRPSVAVLTDLNSASFLPSAAFCRVG